MEHNIAQIVKDVCEKAADHKQLSIDEIETSVFYMPDGFSKLDLDEYLPAPRRIDADIGVETVGSFNTYIEKFKNDNTIIQGYSPTEGVVFMATIEYHGKDDPRWLDHTVKLCVTKTPEWNCWLDKNKKRMQQRDFLHFIEDNAEQIASPDLAEITKHIKNVDLKSHANAQHKVDTTSQSSDTQKALNIESGLPDKIELAISPWRYSPIYKVQARIYLHIEDEGISFSYGLINHERILQHLFDDYRKQIEEGTDLNVLV